MKQEDFTGLNIPFCRKVLEYAEQEQGDDYQFDMAVWYSPYYRMDQNTRQQVVCKTTACLAGTAVMLTPEAEVDKVDDRVFIDGESMEFDVAGAKLMGLTNGQAKHLFYPLNYYQNAEDFTRSNGGKFNEHINRLALQRLRGYIEQAEKDQSP